MFKIILEVEKYILSVYKMIVGLVILQDNFKIKNLNQTYK
jgi:hypothetical protein